MVENREYSVVHGVRGVQIVQEHWGNTEDSGERERTESTVYYVEYREYRNTEGTQRTGGNREYSVVHGVQRVLGEHRTVENGREQGNTEDSRERERTESTV